MILTVELSVLSKIGKMLFIGHNVWTVRNIVTKFHKYVYLIMTMCWLYCSIHYRAYSLSLTGSFNVAWKTDGAAQKWMTQISPRLCKTKIILLCRFSSRPQNRSEISKIAFKDPKTKLNANAFSFNPLTHSGLVHPYQLDREYLNFSM